MLGQTTLAFAPTAGPAFADEAEESRRVPVQLQPARRIDLLTQFAGAFDLAEGEPVGHAVRVAHFASTFARRLRLDAATRRRVLYVALLHDSGTAVREVPEGIDPTGGHTAAGGWIGALMGLGPDVQDAIRATHERWDGEGRPRHLAMDEIPIEALIVSAAHWVADFLGPVSHPLRARAELGAVSIDELEPLVGLRLAHAVRDEVRTDGMWMHLWNEDLGTLVAQGAPAEGRPALHHVDRLALAMGEVVDAAIREPGYTSRVAALAVGMGRYLGLDEPYRRALRVAAQVMDIGQLGVPRHITEKPAILTVEEMEIMQRHPIWAAMILREIPGFAEVARWVEAHHERVDGRGYPDQLEAADIPFGARVLAVADSFMALCSDRPYRAALAPAEALKIIEGLVGTQYDTMVVRALRPALLSMHARPDGKRFAA